MVTQIGLKSANSANIYFKKWRKWKGWTQQELADRMDTTKQTVSRVETGERDWGKGYLEAFAFVTGCEPSDPISRLPNNNKIELILSQADPAKRREILVVVEAMLKTGTDGH